MYIYVNNLYVNIFIGLVALKDIFISCCLWLENQMEMATLPTSDCVDGMRWIPDRHMAIFRSRYYVTGVRVLTYTVDTRLMLQFCLE